MKASIGSSGQGFEVLKMSTPLALWETVVR